jgi:hypothetical protein
MGVRLIQLDTDRRHRSILRNGQRQAELASHVLRTEYGQGKDCGGRCSRFIDLIGKRDDNSLSGWAGYDGTVASQHHFS